MSVMESPEPQRRFDAFEKDCFGPFINRTDDEVTSLILRTKVALGEMGESDQGDHAVLDWDEAHDVLVVAERLWRFRLDHGWSEEAEPEKQDW